MKTASGNIVEIEDRTYFLRGSEDEFDLISEEFLETATGVTVAEAAERVREAEGTSELPLVHCVMKL